MRWKMPLGILAVALLALFASSTTADAQWRRGPSVHGRPGVRVGVGVYFGPRYGYPFWGPYGFYPSYPYPYYRGYTATSDVRVEVEPKNAEVYVDGNYAGIVDDFNGFFQRLTVPAGGHEIEIYLDGYRTLTDRRYFSPGKGYTIKEKMQRLAAGESSGPKPMPAPEPPESDLRPGAMRPGRPGYPTPPAPPPPPGDWREVTAEPQGAESSTFGQLAIRVQPADAEISIDGERWQGLPGQPRLVVDLPPGVHRVEIKKEGFAPFSKQVTVKPRETTVLNVSLSGMN
jgi:hypothetical protein